MSTLSKRSTIYLDPALHRALKPSRSMSEIINDAVEDASVEDAEDIAAFDKRWDEPLISYEDMVNKLKKDGSINIK